MSQYQLASTEITPDRAQVRTALAIAFLLLASSIWIRLPGEIPLPAFPGFILVVDATLPVCDLVTATLLFAQASVFRSRAFMALAAGHLFTGLLTVTHALTFPGAFAATGLLGAGPSSTTWVSFFWRAGFPARCLCLCPAQAERSDAVAAFGASLGVVERVEILPFHYKWAKLQLDYKLTDIQPPSTELVARAIDLFRQAGLEAT